MVLENTGQVAAAKASSFSDDMRRARDELEAADELSDAVAHACRTTSVDLDAAEHALAGAESSAPLVALVGRTKAGKSSFRYALTGLGKEEIGRGGQRTTRSVIPWAYDGVNYLDTPGVGAFGGSADTALTRRACAAADLLAWVVSTDAPQVCTLEDVAAIAREGAPLVVVVNHMEALITEDLLSDLPVQLFNETEAHETQLRERLARLGVEPVSVHHVHLDAAKQQWEGNDPEGRWLRDSRLAAVADSLKVEGIAQASDPAAEARRIARIEEQFRAIRTRVLQGLSAHVSSAEQEIAALKAASEQERLSLLAITKRTVDERFDDLRQELEDALIASRRIGSPEKAAAHFLEEWRKQFTTLATTLPDTVSENVQQSSGTTLSFDVEMAIPALDVVISGNPRKGRTFDYIKFGVEAGIVVASFIPSGGMAGIFGAGGKVAAKEAGKAAAKGTGKLVAKRMAKAAGKFTLSQAANRVLRHKLPSHKAESAKRSSSERAVRSTVDGCIQQSRSDGQDLFARAVTRAVKAHLGRQLETIRLQPLGGKTLSQ